VTVSLPEPKQRDGERGRGREGDARREGREEREGTREGHINKL